MSRPVESGAGGSAASGPERIGRYEVVRELGRGSMGIVYQAEDPALGRTVALKTIDGSVAAAFGGREEFEKRFFAEARIAARLSHPGIVVCHDVGKDARTATLFIVLEYVDGQTLEQRLKAEGPLGWREVAAIMARVARGAHHAHGQGVIHRDLKPANIMLPGSGEPKIMDFGIAKIETARMKLTATGQFLGSPLYMSPEQALGNDLDPRSDIFALGTILCTLLVGRPYFAAGNIPSILARIIREEPPVLSETVPGLPALLDRVIGRAMAKLPSDRYPSADMLADDLEDVLASRPPRHAQGWSPVRSDGTTVGSTDDALLAELAAPPAAADDPLAALGSPVEESAPRATAGSQDTTPLPAPRGPHAATAPVAAPARTAAPATAPLRRTGTRIRPMALWTAVVLAAAASALLILRSRPAPEVVSIPSAVPSPPETTAPDASAQPVPLSPPPGQAPAMAPPKAVGTLHPPERLPPARSHLLVTIEHPLKSGQLRLWIDDALAYETPLQAKVGKKIVAIKIREARIQKTLEVEPGKHEIRVAVTWDDNERVETTFASFRPESRRELEIKLGRIRKNLSLEWR